MITIKVTRKCVLKDILEENINKSKNNLKTLCENDLVLVNNMIVKKLNYIVDVDDEIIVKDKYIKDKIYKKIIDIIYEDKDIIVLNKPDKLLSINDEKKHYSLYNIVSNYVKIKNKNNKIYVIHRLDRDTSGVIMFAKNMKTKNLYQNNYNELIKVREYIGIIHGKIIKSGEITKNLIEEKDGYVHTSNKLGSYRAITQYKPIKYNNKYSMLNIKILTGRKNQIRVHMASIDHPIVGDRKYGIKDNKNRMYLHASKLVIMNPITNKIMEFNSDLPQAFYTFFN